MYKSGLARIKRSLAQARTASCITLVWGLLGGLHTGVWGTLLWQSIFLQPFQGLPRDFGGENCSAGALPCVFATPPGMTGGAATRKEAFKFFS
jgi:hypothetical protein